MRTEPFDKELPCALTIQEHHLKSKALAESLHQRAQIKLEQELANTEFKSRLKAVGEQVELLAREVRTGNEYRQVQCFDRPDWSDGMVETIRTDTGEPVARRPMLPEERQQKLDLERLEQQAAQKQRAKKKRADNDNEPSDDEDAFKKGMQ